MWSVDKSMIAVSGDHKLREIVPNTRLLPCRYVNVDYLARILRLLSTEGLVAEHKSNAGSAVYTLTDAGKLLQVNITSSYLVQCFVKGGVLSTDRSCTHFCFINARCSLDCLSVSNAFV